jgi:hypothetical protein
VHFVAKHKKEIAIDTVAAVGIAAVIVIAPEVAPGLTVALAARIGAARALASAAAVEGAHEGEERVGPTAPNNIVNAARAIGALIRMSDVRPLPEPSLIAINRQLQRLGQLILRSRH